jgi:hypothetical protein
MAGAAGGGGDREASDLCFFIFFCNDWMARAASGGVTTARCGLCFFYFFRNVCRASISVHDTLLMDFEILCHVSILAHDKALPCVTIKSARQSVFTVLFAAMCPLPCVLSPLQCAVDARQSLCFP